ncbi:MAG: hypothetical protein AB1758_28750, partial [Candidatus Eremiobacterota bacterium]
DEEAGPTRRGDEEAGPTRRGDEEAGPTRRGDEEAGPTRRGDEEAGPTRRGDEEGDTRSGEPEDIRPSLRDTFGNTPERADMVRRMQELETARQHEGQVQDARDTAERQLRNNEDRVRAIQEDLQSGRPRTREETRQLNEDLRRAREDVQDSRDHLDRARQAEERARDDLDRARQNLDEARQARLDTDPRGAAQLSHDRAQEARHAETRARDDFRDAVRESVRNPNDPEAQARVREAHDRLQQAGADARNAQEQADHWRQRQGEQMRADRDRLDAFNQDFQDTYGLPGTRQGGYNVPRSLETQDDPHSVWRERNPATRTEQVPITDTGARFDDGSSVEIAGTRRDGTSDRTDSITVPRSQSGAAGFHDPNTGRVVSSSSQVDLGHEAGGHGHAHDNFRDAYGGSRNVNEGFTEFVAQDYRDRRGLQEPPGFDPARPYSNQTQATHALAQALDQGNGEGREAIIRAQLHGEVDQLHERIGRQQGIADPAAARQEGQRIMQLFADGDYQGFRNALGVP